MTSWRRKWSRTAAGLPTLSRLPQVPLRRKILAAFLGVLVMASLLTWSLETQLTRDGLRSQAADLAEEQGRALGRALDIERVTTGQLSRAIVQRLAIDPSFDAELDRRQSAETVLSLVRSASSGLELAIAVDADTGVLLAELSSRHVLSDPGPLTVGASTVNSSQRVAVFERSDGARSYGLLHVVLVSRVEHPYLLAIGYPLDSGRARHLRQLTGADDVEIVVDGELVGTTRLDPGDDATPAGDWERVAGAQTLDDGRTVRYVRIGGDHGGGIPAAAGLIIDDPLAALDSQLARTRALMVALLVVVGGLLAFALAGVMTRPLFTLTTTATAIAGGDLDRSFQVDRRDEIGTLAGALERMRRALRAQLLVIRQQAQALQDAARRIVGVQDAERHRLAQDLHDGIQQQLVVLRMQVGVARTQLEQDPSRLDDVVDGLATSIDQVLDELRTTGQALFPSILRDRGLGGALFSLAARSEVPIDVRLDPDPLPRVDEAVETNAYFLVCEAVTNALKHARANRIVVEVVEEGEFIRVHVSDDGVGFDASETWGSGGVIHMRDRVNAVGGSLQVVSRLGAGTRVTALLPLSVGGSLQVEEDGRDPSVELDLLGESELAEDGVGVLLDRAVGDRQLAGDGDVAAPGRHQAQDVELPRRQPGQP